MTEPSATRPEAPTPMPTRRRRDRELWVGLFALAGVIFIVVALFTLTEPSTFRGRYNITTVVDDAAGIRRGDPVQLKGVIIGRVKGFKLAPQGVTVRLEIEGEYRIPRDSQVVIKSGGILGGMVADVIPGRSSEPLPKGGELPGSTGETLTGAAERVAVESTRVLERLQSVLSDRTVAGIEDSSVELAELLKNVSAGITEQRASFLALSTSLTRSASNLEQLTGPTLQRSVSRIDALTRGMEGMSPRVQSTIASLDRSAQTAQVLLDRIAGGHGTLGLLTKDEALYKNAERTLGNLNRAAVELRLLGEDVRKNPGRYVKLSLF